MLTGLMLTAFLMGLGGIPHCAAMCGAPCAVAFPRGLPWLSLLGRCLGYSLLGALAAVSAGTIAAWGRQIAFLQPLWMMLLVVAIMLGLYLLRSGQMPTAINNGAQDLYRKVRDKWPQRQGKGWPPAVTAVLPLLAGMAWAVMPCGLLYAALMVAALAPDAPGGALVMLAFAIPSALGVWGAPAVLGWLARLAPARQLSASAGAGPAAGGLTGSFQDGAAVQAVPITWLQREAGLPAAAPCVRSPAASQFDPRWAVRIAGLMLAGMAAWALYHQLWAQWQAWCA